jgi:hypothetical protein
MPKDNRGGPKNDTTNPNQLLQLEQETIIALNTTDINNKITQGSQDTLTYAQQVGSYVKNESTNVWQPLIAHHSNKNLKVIDATLNTTLSSIDNKITQGADQTLSQAQQVLCYGEVTSGAGSGELHPIHITQSGDVEVSIADIEKKGQELMSGSFPVVISSDQSTLNVDRDYKRTTTNQSLSVPSGTTKFSNSINMNQNGNIAFYGVTDNSTNANISVQYSANGTEWYTGHEPDSYIKTNPSNGQYFQQSEVIAPYVRLKRTNTSASDETLIVNVTIA